MSVILGDCIEEMAKMEASSIDAIVTDPLPPYGLEFMGKEWDSFRPTARANRGGVAPGRARRDPAKKAPVAYGVAPRRVTFTCDGCGKRDKFKNAHACDAGWSSLRLADDHAAYGNAMQEWHHRWAAEALRVAKPGAYLLAFGGTRTVHRMTCAIEDAGWVIRDVLVWAYAQGFPKSRASLKPAWEPIVMARKPGASTPLQIDAARIGIAEDDAELRSSNPVSNSKSFGGFPGGTRITDPTLGGRHQAAGRWPANVVLTDPIFDGDVPGVVGGGEQASPADYQRSVVADGGIVGWNGEPPGALVPGYGDTGTYSRFFEVPRGDACNWCGAPTASASSSLPSPSDGSAPSRARTSPDGTPVSTASEADQATGSGTNGTGTSIWPELTPDTASPSDQRARSAVLPPTSIATTTTTPSRSLCERCAADATTGRIPPLATSTGRGLPRVELPDYPRFYCVPKADRGEREPLLPSALAPRVARVGVERHSGNPTAKNGQRVDIPRRNTHPTVKPLDLMRHLVRLVTPPGGTVLDCFAGSGTTLIACEMEGFEWVGIEREPEYVEIIRARLLGTQRGLGLAEVPA